MKLRLLCPLFCALTLGACHSPTTNLHAPTKTLAPANDSTFKLIENVHQYTLDNGLTVIIKEDKRAPVVMTQVWYKVGSNDEPKGKGGISHFVEHLMFKDTPKVSGDEFSRLIAHYGGQNNAYTNTNVTVYHELLPANRYALALELEANRMKNILFKDEQISSEREVILEERRVRTDDNPMAKSYEQIYQFIYGDTPRGRPVIGSVQDIKAISSSDLKNWYDTWYAPNNATLVLVGNVNKDEAMSHIKKYFGSLPRHDTPTRNPKHFIHADDLTYSTPKTPINRHLTIKEAVQVPTIFLVWQAPSISSLKLQHQFTPKNQRELLSLALLDDVLSGGASARFAKNLVKKELVSSAFTHYDITGYGDSLFIVGITPKAGADLDETKALVLGEIARTLEDTIEQKELDRSQVALKTSLVFASDDIAKQADLLGTMSTEGLPFEYIKDEFELMQTITPSEIKQAGKKYLNSERMYSFYVLPNGQ